MSFWDTTKKTVNTATQEVGGFWDGLTGTTRYNRTADTTDRAYKLTHAIQQVETGGKQVSGASGEFGAFQFMPATWNTISKQVNGSVLPQTPQNEFQTAQKKIQSLLAQGYTERQVGLIWNTSLGGSEKPLEIKGVNKKGVKYDSGAYANKVQSAFNGLNIPTPVDNTPHGIALNTVKGLPEAATQVGKGIWDYVGTSFQKASPTSAGPLIRPDGSINKAAVEAYQNTTGGFVGGGDTNVAKTLAPELKSYIAQQAKSATEGGGIAKFFTNAKTKLVDFTAPIEDTLSKTLKENNMKLKPSQDINDNIARVLRAPTLASQFIKDNGFEKVIQTVGNDHKLFDQYLIARHAKDLEARGVQTGRDPLKDSQLVQSLAPHFEQQAQQVTDYSHKLLDRATETGLISKDVAGMLKERYPNYVPFQRVFDTIEQHSNAGGVASLSRQTVVRAIEGSDRKIESPVASLLQKTNDLFRQGEKNLAAKTLASYEKLPGNPFNLKEVTAGQGGTDSISFLDNGKKRTFTTSPEIAQAAKALNVQQMNILGKILQFPVRVARLGITGINAPFVAANISKDQVSAFINSNNSLKTSVANPSVFLPAIYNAIGHGKLYKEWIRAGGGGTSFDLSRSQIESTVGAIRAGRNVPSKVAYTVTHPGQLLRAVENVMQRSEELTRLQQFGGTKQALLKQGMSEADAVAGAARASRENTVDFARRGEWGTVLNSAFLYLNASIQGTRTLLRNLKTKPLATSAKIATTALLPVAYATNWNLSDPERRKIYEDIPDYEKDNNLIIIPPGATKDDQGRWNVIKIPISQEVNHLTAFIRRPIESMYGYDPVGFGDAAKALIGTVSPVEPTLNSALSTFTPQAIKPTIEGAVNKNLFTGIPQVKQSLLNKPTGQQVKPYTSGTARQIGDMIGLSPIKVEEWIKGTFGGAGSQALNAVDHVLATAGAIPQDQIGGQDILDAITARFNKAHGGQLDNNRYEAEAKAAQEKAQQRDDFKKATYDPVQELVANGDHAGAQKIVDSLSEEDYKKYVGIRQGERSKRTEEMRSLLKSDPKKAVEYIKSQEAGEAIRLLNVMTDAEYAIYEASKNKTL